MTDKSAPQSYASEESRLMGNADSNTMRSQRDAWTINRRSRFFKDGSNMIDEMSFVYYYHSSPPNQALHLTTTLCLFLGIFCLLAFPDPLRPHGVPVLSIAFAAAYILYYFYLHPPVAVAFASAFAGLLYVSSLVASHTDAYPNALYIAAASIICAALQGLGHVVFERRLPAFRLFEFGVTTPFTLMLVFLMAFGYARDLREAIAARSAKWQGTERRKF